MFDRPDLKRHNVNTMSVQVFKQFAERHNHRICYLGYAGRLRFWNVDTGGPIVIRRVRAVGGRLTQVIARCLGRLLPAEHPWIAPWLVYIGEKTHDQT